MYVWTKTATGLSQEGSEIDTVIEYVYDFTDQKEKLGKVYKGQCGHFKELEASLTKTQQTVLASA